jgi:hypothetical protein
MSRFRTSRLVKQLAALVFLASVAAMCSVGVRAQSQLVLPDGHAIGTGRRTTLKGNIHPLAHAHFDRGVHRFQPTWSFKHAL